jgi:hypothetical protein
MKPARNLDDLLSHIHACLNRAFSTLSRAFSFLNSSSSLTSFSSALALFNLASVDSESAAFVFSRLVIFCRRSGIAETRSGRSSSRREKVGIGSVEEGPVLIEVVEAGSCVRNGFDYGHYSCW